jgi:hypothetical protein
MLCFVEGGRDARLPILAFRDKREALKTAVKDGRCQVPAFEDERTVHPARRAILPRSRDDGKQKDSAGQ